MQPFSFGNTVSRCLKACYYVCDPSQRSPLWEAELDCRDFSVQRTPNQASGPLSAAVLRTRLSYAAMFDCWRRAKIKRSRVRREASTTT